MLGVEPPFRCGDVEEVRAGGAEARVDHALQLDQIFGAFVHDRSLHEFYGVETLLYAVEMATPTAFTSRSLGVERIVDAACVVIERDGLAGLSMRRLGAELGVDPMAVYHHVANKRALLALVTSRAMAAMEPPDPRAPWDARVRQWAIRYWELVVAHRELVLAGLGDPAIATGGLAATQPLITAITDSGLRLDLVEPSAFIVVDAVHGAALSVRSIQRGDDDLTSLRAVFEVGLDTLVAGITARADPAPS